MLFLYEEIAVNGNRDRTLQEIDTDYQTESIFDFQQDTLHIPQRASCDAYLLPNFQEGVWAHGQSGGNQPANRIDLMFGNRGRAIPEAHEFFHARGGENLGAAHQLRTAEEVSGKEGKLDLLNPVRPAVTNLVQRQKLFAPFIAQRTAGDLLVSAFGDDC